MKLVIYYNILCAENYISSRRTMSFDTFIDEEMKIGENAKLFMSKWKSNHLINFFSYAQWE